MIVVKPEPEIEELEPEVPLEKLSPALEPPLPTVTVITVPALADCVEVLNPPAPPPAPVAVPLASEPPPEPPPATTKKSIEYDCGVSKVTSSSTVGIQPCVAPE